MDNNRNVKRPSILTKLMAFRRSTLVVDSEEGEGVDFGETDSTAIVAYRLRYSLSDLEDNAVDATLMSMSWRDDAFGCSSIIAIASLCNNRIPSLAARV